MSKRLQVIIEDGEYEDLRRVAEAKGMTVSAWVRDVLRQARRGESSGDVERRLAVVRAAARHTFPTGDIEEMLADIERGYLGR